MPGASDRPPTLAELNERASTAGLLAQNPNYAVRTWIKSATTLLEEGNKYYLAGDIDQAYVNLMKGLSIALELLPKHKDFNVNDLHYVQLRGKLNNVMETTDRLKALIQKRSSEAAAGAAATPAAFAARAASPARGLQRSGSQRAVVPAQLESGATTSPAPAAAPRTRPPDGSLLDSSNPNLAVAGSTPKIGDVISSRQLFDILLNLRMSVLILDVRSPVEFSAGHIGWKRSRGDGAVALGGTVNINPEWYFVGSLSSADVASNIMAFGAQSMVQSKLFECRDSVDLIVLHDASSMKLVDSDALNKIFGSIYQFEFERIPKRKPAVLRGGYAAWVTFLDTTDATIADWIEIGDGSGVFQVDGAAEQPPQQPQQPQQQQLQARAARPEPPALAPKPTSLMGMLQPIGTDQTSNGGGYQNSQGLQGQGQAVAPRSQSPAKLTRQGSVREQQQPPPEAQPQQQSVHLIRNAFEYVSQRQPLGQAKPAASAPPMPSSPLPTSPAPHTPPRLSSKYGIGAATESRDSVISRFDDPFFTFKRGETGNLDAAGLDRSPLASVKAAVAAYSSSITATATESPTSYGSALVRFPDLGPVSSPQQYLVANGPSAEPPSRVEGAFDIDDEIAGFDSAYPELPTFSSDSAPAIPPKPAALANALASHSRAQSPLPPSPAAKFDSASAKPIQQPSQLPPPVLPKPVALSTPGTGTASSSQPALKPQASAPSLIPQQMHMSSSSPAAPAHASQSVTTSAASHSGLPKPSPVPSAANRQPFSQPLAQPLPQSLPQPVPQKLQQIPVGPISMQQPLAMPAPMQQYPQQIVAPLPVTQYVAPPPPVMMRRSSSPSPSPATQRFYQPLPDAYERAALSNIPGSAPRVPPKPALAGISNLPTPVTAMDSVSQGMASMQLGSLNLGMAGLKNLGNTCFMNSVIQCLSSTIPLSRFFLSGSYRKFINKRNPLGSKGRMAESYASLMQMMWRAQEAVVTPSQFKLTIGELNASFAGSDQQDSQEFLAALLDALHEDLNLARTGPEPKAAGKSKEPEPDTERIPDEELLESEWRVYRNRNWSIIVDMFQGVLKSSLRCLTCGKTSKTFNPFMYLSLPIPKQNQQGVKGGPVLLDECLRKFSEEEILDGEDAWYVKRRAVKCLTIAKLPTVLLIHLKRFSFDGPFRNKVETYVHFQTNNLDLTRFVMQKPPVPGGPLVLPETHSYDLYAISNHFGGLNGGHYTAHVKNNYQKTWLNFDDSRIGRTDEKSIRSPAAYILFYVRAGAPTMSGAWWSQDSARF
ncbi:ubiquitin-specific protease doa4 [Polyrhizophydium stewartii]|uniref:ubiquitinyl hydrolase 1 n=1 Tax=Polyrhizophydium stewartii TaxID=2732419 RepID=A0ABR4NGD0_9FUNG